jgi:3-deoxy-D-manno-octulosonic-acid transferase
VGLVAARLSARSAARWGRLEWLARPLLARIALAAPQDAASAERLLSLGLPPAALGPETVLKAAVALPVPAAEEVAALGFDRAETVLAASTHAGEEGPVLAAFARARATRPGLRLILAPRHPERSAEIARRIAAAGLAHATRSAGEAPNGGASGRASSGREAPGSEAPGQLSRQQPSPGQGSPRRVSTEEESPGQRSAGQASGQASAGQASTGQASTGRVSPGRASTGQGSAGHGSAGHASPGRASVGQGSAGRLSTGGAAPVYLADTLGEMPLWYAAAGICFVGGSLVPKGGHTPFEPAQFGCAILHGPHIANAADAYGRLAGAGAAIEVATEDALADALVTLDATAQARLARAARAALAPADLRPLLDAIDARLLRLPPDRAE